MGVVAATLFFHSSILFHVWFQKVAHPLPSFSAIERTLNHLSLMLAEKTRINTNCTEAEMTDWVVSKVNNSRSCKFW